MLFLPFNKWQKMNFKSKIKKFSVAFLSHLDLCSIVQHISCPSTPEQNEVTKRKHRYIVETGFTMLFYAQLPKNLWIESFLTAVYLINRLPSSVLGMDTPFFKLHEVHPDYSSLKDFGRRCFPYLRDQSKNNLNRSFTRVFSLAIVPHKKALGVFIRLQREFISPHVVFDESILSYTDPKSLFSCATTSGSFSTYAKCSSGFLSSQQASVAPPVSLPKLRRLTLPVLGNYTWDTSIISIPSISSSTKLPPSAPTTTLALDFTGSYTQFGPSRSSSKRAYNSLGRTSRLLHIDTSFTYGHD